MMAEAGPQTCRISFTVVDGWSRYPVELQADMIMTWTQLVEAWYQKASIVPGWDARKYPKDATAHIMKDVNDNVIEHMDGVDRVFAYYIPSLTGSNPPQIRDQAINCWRTDPTPGQSKR
jgi:hypothetical protein